MALQQVGGGELQSTMELFINHSQEFRLCFNDKGKFLQTFKEKNDTVTLVFWKTTQAAFGKQTGEGKTEGKGNQLEKHSCIPGNWGWWL